MRKICHYSLLEVMLVMALFGILSNGALQMYYHGRSATMRQIRQADLLVSLDNLTAAWRDFAARAGRVSACTPGHLDFINGGSASIVDGRLLLKVNGWNRVLALPEGYGICVHKEDDIAGGHLLVLDIYEPGSANNVRKDRFFRIVACEEGEE